MFVRVGTELLLICAALAAAHVDNPDRRTLAFAREPPGRVDFLNETGAEVPCSARGSPSVRWEWKDGTPLQDVSGLRHVRPDGTLVFEPFDAAAYRQDVHLAVYRCTASSPAGKIGSREVHVRGVLRQPYKVQVFDEYTVTGNTAVLRCSIPSFVKDYVVVTSWVRDDSRTIVAGSETGGRYSVFPSGELHIRGATLEDGFKSYRCVTRNRLTGEVSPSAAAGKLYVTDARSGVSPRITHSQAKVETRVGETVELPCAAQGHPVPSYSWLRIRDGPSRGPKRVDVSDGRVVEREGSLLIRRASVQDGGTYVCVVNNTGGQERAETELLVTEPLEVVAVPRWQSVSSGSTALLSCNVTGHPLPSVTWLKDMAPVAEGPRISPAHRGVYQCFARNDKETAQDVAQVVLGDVAPVFRSVFEPSKLEPGSPLSLRCSASGHPLPQVTWSLDDLPVPDHTRFSVGDYVTSRAEVVSFVNITNVRVEDGGVYRCSATNDLGVASHSAKVHVIGPPFVRPMKDVAAVQGDVLVVRCPVAGYPVEEVYWEKGGRRIPFNHRQRAFRNGTFFIRDLDRRSDPGEYRCVARNSQGQRGERTLHIRVLMPPVIEPFNFPPAIEEGSRSKILCSVTRGDPPVTVDWLKDGRPLSEPDVSVTGLDEFSSALLFRRVRLRHRGDYTCTARNMAASDSFTATMVVHAPPRWVTEPTPTEAVLGSDVTLNCAADGFPKPQVVWKRARDPLASDYDVLLSDAHVQSLANGSLSIRGLQKSDAGSYMCQASNGIGVGIGTVVTLRVRVPAHFKEEFVAETVRRGDELVVRCRAFGDRPLTVTWKKDGQPLDQQAEKKYSVDETTIDEGLTSEIRIESADRRDSSLFTCLARNVFGRDEMNVQIIVQERPDKPFKVTPHERTSRSVTLSWSPPYSGNSPILTYTVQFKPTTSDSWTEDANEITTSGLESKLLVSGLQPATSYHFRVMAENAFGKSDYSAAVSVTTDLEVPGGPPLSVQAEAVGSHTLRVTWQPPPADVHNGPLSGYYVGYKIRSSGQPYTYKTLEASGNECLVTGLRRLTTYDVIVQAFNEKGAGPPSLEVDVQTNDNDPPTNPILSVKSTTHDSIEVQWEVAPSASTHIEGFQVHYKREMGGWQELSVPGDRRRHLFEGLECGTRYDFFVTAFNEVGQGLPSDAVSANTLGVAPVAPLQATFVRSNSTGALLHLSEWQDGGCPVDFFVVQYREEEGGEWRLASDRLAPRAAPFELQGLNPDTRYRLHVAAHSDAGVTQAEYAFVTGTMHEQTEHAVVPDRKGSFAFYTNLAIVAPVVVTALILVSVLTVVCALGKRRRNGDTQYDDSRSVRKVTVNPEASVQMSEYEVKPDYGGQSKQASVCLPSPYAASRVPVFSVAEEGPDSAGRPYDLPFAARQGADTRHAKEALTQSKVEHMYSFQRGSRRPMHPEGPFLYPEHVT